MEVKIPMPTREELDNALSTAFLGLDIEATETAHRRLAIYDAVMRVTDKTICDLSTHLERALSFDLDRAFLYTILTRENI